MTSSAAVSPIRTALDRLLFRLMSEEVKSALENSHDRLGDEIDWLQYECDHPDAQAMARDVEHLWVVSFGCWS